MNGIRGISGSVCQGTSKGSFVTMLAARYTCSIEFLVYIARFVSDNRSFGLSYIGCSPGFGSY